MGFLGFVYANASADFECRLKAAVDAGEVSQVQTELMRDTLLRSSSTTREMETKKRGYQRFVRAIKKAREADRISSKEAEKQRRDLKPQVCEQDRGEDDELPERVRRR